MTEREWVRALSTELFVALGAHGLRADESALAAIAQIVKAHVPRPTPPT